MRVMSALPWSRATLKPRADDPRDGSNTTGARRSAGLWHQVTRSTGESPGSSTSAVVCPVGRVTDDRCERHRYLKPGWMLGVLAGRAAGIVLSDSEALANHGRVTVALRGVRNPAAVEAPDPVTESSQEAHRLQASVRSACSSCMLWTLRITTGCISPPSRSSSPVTIASVTATNRWRVRRRKGSSGIPGGR